MEELEPPWASGTSVADIFAADVPKYSDFFEPNIPGEEIFCFFGERGQEQVTIARFCSLTHCQIACRSVDWR